MSDTEFWIYALASVVVMLVLVIVWLLHRLDALADSIE